MLHLKLDLKNPVQYEVVVNGKAPAKGVAPGVDFSRLYNGNANIGIMLCHTGLRMGGGLL